ncbi:MAG TPA: DUF6318 family protein [Brachybacterium faecium]|nr:DUF6318 family protein [Brachybacterium faecium]
MPRRLFSAAAAGALLLGLAACGDTTDGPATAPPPDLGIAAPSDGGGAPAPSDGGGEQTDPSADAPDIPPPDPADYAGMDENTPEGAEQAFRYYIAVSMWAHQSGEDGPLTALEADSCGGCDYLNEDITSARERELLWSDTTIEDVSVSTASANSFDHEVRYKFTLSPHSRADQDFDEYIEVEYLDYDTVGGMNWDEGVWLVAEMSIEWGEDAH